MADIPLEAMAGMPSDSLGPLAVLFGAFMLVFLFIILALYVYYAFALMTMARKTNTGPVWLAWIPIANIYLMTKIAKLEWWWTFGILLGAVPIVGWLAAMAWSGYIFWKIAEVRGFEGWYGLLTLIPLIGLIFVGIIAWGEPKKA
jgi:uncharacterized membrane protein